MLVVCLYFLESVANVIRKQIGEAGLGRGTVEPNGLGG